MYQGAKDCFGQGRPVIDFAYDPARSTAKAAVKSCFVASGPESALDTDRLNRWLTLGANIGVLVGLLLLVAELRQTNSIAKAEAINVMTQNSYTILQMYREPRNIDALDRITEVGWDRLTNEEELLVSSVESMVISHIQNAYIQHRLGVIGDDYFDAMLWTLDQGMQEEWRRSFWEDAKASYTQEFRSFVDHRLENIPDSHSER